MYADFIVKFDPATQTRQDLGRMIIQHIYYNRIRGKKPTVTFIGGDSGEGKSTAALVLMQTLLEKKDISLKDYLHDVNVYIPLEYTGKLDALLYDKRLRRVNCFCIHEAREVIKAKNWMSFLNQAISDVNAMSRAVKRINTFIVSQFIRDISKDIRYTINFYVRTVRPSSQKARLYFFRLWKDDRDLDNPVLRKRRLQGYVVTPTKTYRFIPSYIQVKMPEKEICDAFDEKDYKAKSEIIKRKLNKLLQIMEQDIEKPSEKIKTMVKFYTEEYERLDYIGRRVRGKLKLSPKFKEMHGLTDIEVKMFRKELDARLEILSKENSAIKDEDLTENGMEQKSTADGE